MPISMPDVLSASAAIMLEVMALTLWLVQPAFLGDAVVGFRSFPWSAAVGGLATVLPILICWLCVRTDDAEADR